MIKLVRIGAFAALLVLSAGGSARAETWCMRQLDGSAGACVFSSGEDCSRAARLSAAGGICEREPLKPEPDDRRRSNRARTSDR